VTEVVRHPFGLWCDCPTCGAQDVMPYFCEDPPMCRNCKIEMVVRRHQSKGGK
jgi:uncharacterized protein (DUF983 family)